MNAGFVWFTHSTDNTTEAVAFYEKLLGWKAADGPPGMTMFAGESGPFAGVADKKKASGWIPYAQVADVDEATKKAVALGAKIVEKKSRGPAGEFTVVRDPGGAHVALWQKG